jgi:hypothetical protein
MCQRGVQQLREDEVLVLLEEIREKHSQRKTHPLHTHSPEEFLKILKHRTSILVEVGTVKHNGLLVPVYEFRHLTFQEYLASLALLSGDFPGHDKTKRLAERVAPLAGEIEEVKGEFVVSENWREALRLCIASCNVDDVDEAIEAILTPLATEDAEKTTRPRAVLATLCLADEPNVSEEVGSQVLQMFVQQVVENDGIEHVKTSLNSAAMEIARSVWAIKLQRKLAKAFCQDRSKVSYRCGNLCGMMGKEIIFALPKPTDEINKLIEQLGCADKIEVTVNTLIIMNIALNRYFPKKLVFLALDKLVLLLNQSAAIVSAVAWAMGWLAVNRMGWLATDWARSESNIQAILTRLTQPDFDKITTYWLIIFVGEIKEIQAVKPLIAKLDDEDKDVRQQALGALAKITRDETDQKLLSKYFDAEYSWLDPKEPIAHARIAKAAETLNLPPEEIQRRYEELAQQFGLILEWKQ